MTSSHTPDDPLVDIGLSGRDWGGILQQVARPPDPASPVAKLGPFRDRARAYAAATRISTGKIAGSEPAGKFIAESKTMKGSGTFLWIQLNPDFDSHTLDSDPELETPGD